MDDVLDRQLVPTPFRIRPNQIAYAQYIFVRWLDVEVDPAAPQRMPILAALTRWRNREVYGWVQANKARWQARLVAELYG